MSKRKTTDKSSLNGPRAKRQKLGHGHANKNDKKHKNNNKKQNIVSSRICNDENEANKTTIINAHCYDEESQHNNNNEIPCMIEIKKHNMSLLSLNNNNANTNYNNNNGIQYDKLCGKINQRLKIYWNEDKQWYYGTIKDFKASTNESLIVYDDNESEWLNLTKSGHETVEFLYDDNNNNTANNIEHKNENIIEIGNKISSGKVLQTFNNGCIANINLKLENKKNCNLTAIAFDSKYIDHIFKNELITNHNMNQSNDIFKLLHLCQFDKSINDIHTNHNYKRKRNRNNKKAIEIEMKNSNTINKNNETAPWILIGCTSDTDPITKSDDGSHINLIHSNHVHNKYKLNNNNSNNNKAKRYNGYNSNKNKNKLSYNGKYANIYNSNSNIYNNKNQNKITKKCNNKSMIDLKAIYPLQKIRQQNHNKKRTVIVIGAGISGLSCARELMNYGYNVIVLEARNRAGGRILTDYTLGLDTHHGCDVGGGWIHGVERNPLTRLVERLKLTLHSTSGTIQMFDYKGRKVDELLDEKVEKEFNALLDRISKENEERYNRIHGDNINTNNNNNMNDKYSQTNKNSNVSLGETLNAYLNEKKKKKKMSTEELNLWNWHFSNLEYSNAADLCNLSLTDWDQDDEYAFNGDHCLVQEGYGRIIHGLKQGINIKYQNIVTKIDWSNGKIVVSAKKNNNMTDIIQNDNDQNVNGSISPDSTIESSVNSDRSNSNSNSSLNTSLGVHEKNEIMNDNINMEYEHGNANENNMENVSRIELTQMNENDNEISNKNCVPIYAMLPKSKDSFQFVKLKDIKGKCQYNMQQNGHNNNEEDIDVSMSDDNDNENESEEELMEYMSDAVVVTLPLGILKNNDVEFKPNLPQWKQNAIDGIGYGLLNKIFLKFEHVFWDINNDYIGYASSTHGEFYLFVNLVPVSGTPVLMSLVSGSFAEKLEQKTDEQIVDYAMKILRNIFSKKNNKNNKFKTNKKSKRSNHNNNSITIPSPIDYYVTKWGQDRFAKGSYSYIAMGSNGDFYDKLSYSVGDKIYFAGEATIRKWPASVHGAYLSGIREARKIMNNHYIHNEEKQLHQRNLKHTQRRNKRKKTNSFQNNNNNNELTPHLLKAGLSEFPTDTIFKPIKDIAIRMSTRRNSANKYSSKYNNNKSKKKIIKKNINSKKNTKAIRNNNKRVRRQHENINDNENDISSMSDTSSITSSANDSDIISENENDEFEYEDNYHKDLICTLCGGNGYLSDDMMEKKNKNNKKKRKKKNKNEKLIGPFVIDNKSNNNNNNRIYIHYGCGQWSPDIVNNSDNVWYNVISCIKRSKYIRCCYCCEYGATVNCHNMYCLSSYHPECAHTTQYWDFNRPDEGYLFFCIKHRNNMLSLHIKQHKTKLLSIHKNKKNKLRQPRPPSIRK